MKKLILLLTALIISAGESYAQINPDDPDCRVWYTYDAAGQRVKRYYDCISGLPDVNHPIRIDLFPNPTSGQVIVVTDVYVDAFTVLVYNIGGSLITSTECNECSMATVHISNQPPGSYLVQASIQKDGYENLTKGFTVIKQDE